MGVKSELQTYRRLVKELHTASSSFTKWSPSGQYGALVMLDEMCAVRAGLVRSRDLGLKEVDDLLRSYRDAFLRAYKVDVLEILDFTLRHTHE